MDNIGHFNEVKQGFENLKYNEKSKLDKLSRQLVMLIENILPEKPQYVTGFQLLKFRFIPAYMSDNVQRMKWDTDTQKTINLIDTIIEELKLFPKSISKNIIDESNKDIDRTKVFIVHGHDDGAKNEVARFIEKLGLEAIIVHEQTSSGDTIIEKVIRYSDVGFGDVLYTACDIGTVKSEPENLKPRARQNVVFEHGFLIGKIGRKNVIALVKDNVEKPNDISGVVYETIDSKGAWKFQLAREMKASGYDIDMNKVS